MTRPLLETLIAWKRNSDQAMAVPYPDRMHLSAGLRMTDGACYAETARLTEEERKRYVLNLFHTLVMRSRPDLQAALAVAEQGQLSEAAQ